MTTAADRTLFSTGIPSIDELLGGGIPRRQSLIVTGDPGSGKTILCSQIAAHAALRGDSAVLATVTSEPHEKLVAELSGFSFFDRELLGDRLFLMSIYGALKKGSKEARDLLIQTVRERKAKLLFVDGLRAVRDLWQDEARFREFLYELGIGLAALDCIGVFTTEYGLERLLALPEATTVDGIVSVGVNRGGARRLRRIEVVKLRGRRHLTGEHYFQIDESGASVIPRIEARAAPPMPETHAEDRLSFGLPELDALMEGGLPRRTMTVLAGSMGVGKTLLSAYFAVEGARRDEKSLFVSFTEQTPGLVARARRVGLELAGAIASGHVTIQHEPPSEVEADVLVDRILRRQEELGAERLIIDGLGYLEAAVMDQTRRAALLASLSIHLRARGVTGIFSHEVSKVAGMELDLGDTPFAALGDNILLLRYVELRGRIHRILSILKMRDSRSDGDLREFEIANTGLRVLAPLRSAAGLLTGQARPLGTGIGGEQ